VENKWVTAAANSTTYSFI